MDNNADLSFFNAAMKKVQTGTTADEFAGHYADASNAKKGSTIWQNYFQKGLKEFSTIDIHKGSDGKIDEEEFNMIKVYVDRLNGKIKGDSQTIEDFSGNRFAEMFLSQAGKPQEKVNPNLDENHNLKPVEAMTKEELEAELETYRREGVIKEETPSANEEKIPEEKKDRLPKDDAAERSKKELKEKFNINKPEGIKVGLKDGKTQADSILSFLRKDVADARHTRNEMDKNSDKIDYHIGTFNQGGLGTCSMLSQLNGMSDEQMKRMIQKKTDEQGKTYYEVTFPMDSGTDKSVKITEEELNNRHISVDVDGKTIDVNSFSSGDADVTLLEMAYIRRFGMDPVINGGDLKLVHDIFTYPEEQTQHVGTSYEVTEDKIRQAVQNKDHVTIGLLHVSRLPENFSYLATQTSTSGIGAEWKFGTPSDRRNAIQELEKMLRKLNGGQAVDMSKYEEMSDAELMEATNRYVSADYGFIGCLNLSNGYKIIENHAYSLKGYDENTKEVIIVNPHNSNEDIRVPIEIARQFFEMSA